MVCVTQRRTGAPRSRNVRSCLCTNPNKDHRNLYGKRVLYPSSSFLKIRISEKLDYLPWYNLSVKREKNWAWLTCEEIYSIQSSSLASIGMKLSLVTDNVGEFSFLKRGEKVQICMLTSVRDPIGELPNQYYIAAPSSQKYFIIQYVLQLLKKKLRNHEKSTFKTTLLDCSTLAFF